MTGRLTRAQARQLARQMGWRGSKAKRDNVARRRREIAVMRPMADLTRLRAVAKEG